MRRILLATALLSTLLWMAPAGAEEAASADAATSVTVESAGDDGGAPQRTVPVESADAADRTSEDDGTALVWLGVLATAALAVGAAIGVSRGRARVARGVAE